MQHHRSKCTLTVGDNCDRTGNGRSEDPVDHRMLNIELHGIP
jgi:hypothetical protein